jgi:hypothetical protein
LGIAPMFMNFWSWRTLKIGWEISLKFRSFFFFGRRRKQNKGEIVGYKNRKIRLRFLPMFYEFLGWRKWNFRLEVLLMFRRFVIKENF